MSENIMAENKMYRESFLLRTCDCDLMGAWRPSAILTAMQEAAGMHSFLLGCGRDELLKKGIVWVLSRCEVRMEKYPRVGETVTVETFPTALRRWFFPRHFLFKNGRGETLGCACTLWVLLDVKERKMAPPGEVAATIPANADLTPPLPMPGAVEDVDGAETVSVRLPAYFDLDVNGHVNNTRYADWACDALGVECMREYELASLRINYAAEIRPGQETALHTFRSGKSYRVAGFHGDKMHFELGGTLRKRNYEDNLIEM